MKRPKPFYSKDKNLNQMIQLVLESSHWKEVVKLTEEYLNAIDKAFDENEDIDPDEYERKIVETVLKTIYGEDIYNYINSKLI